VANKDCCVGSGESRGAGTVVMGFIRMYIYL
jgi:hypothetical protein